MASVRDVRGGGGGGDRPDDDSSIMEEEVVLGRAMSSAVWRLVARMLL